MTASGIRFNDCSFSEPVPLADWAPPRFPGLLAILANDPNWAPRPFQPLDFIEFGNNADFAALIKAAKRDGWYVAVLPMPFSTTAQRCWLRDELIRAYNPVRRFDAIREIAEEPPRTRRSIGFAPPPEPAYTGTSY